MAKADPDEELLSLAVECEHDPDRWARLAFDWGHGALKDVDGPREWQSEINRTIKDHLSNPGTRFEPLLIAVASGHGIGKSAEMGMLANWAMSTCDDTRIIVTANTDKQLRTKTAPEIGKWFRLSLTSHWFNVQAESVRSVADGHSDSWRADFIPWSEHNTEAFAGLHNKGKRIVLMMDEGSAIADKIWEVAEGALTDEGTEIIWIVFGNPTRNTGRFRECFRRYRHRWVTRQIDSRTVPGTNKNQIQKWVDDYGEDSDFVKVRVRGQFPAASALQFISTDDADAARGKHLRPEQYEFAPKIIGVDPAWTGDDEFVIFLRQGLYSKCLATFTKNDNDIQMAQHVLRFEQEHQADAVFIDGGHGTGIYSAGKSWGRNWVLVWFGEQSSDPGCVNKRVQMWRDMRQWLKEGGAIDPSDDVLYQDLIGPELVQSGSVKQSGKLQLESKEDMKARGIPSPNRADALALTFAHPVVPKSMPAMMDDDVSHETEFNPYD
jgi:hypothetical protein